MATIPFEADLDLLRNQLKNACLQNRSATPTDRAVGQVWLDTTSGSQRIKFDIAATSHTPISVPRVDLNEMVTGLWDFDPTDQTKPPFTVGSGIKVDFLNADRLDNKHASVNLSSTVFSEVNGTTIAMRYTNGRLKVGNPEDNMDAANKGWVLGQIQHRAFKRPVRVATIWSIDQVAVYSNDVYESYTERSINDDVQAEGGDNLLTPIDGVDDLALNDRVLVKGPDIAANTGDRKFGIYKVTAVGSETEKWTLTRTDDANTAGDLYPGASVFVTEGDTNADTIWSIVSNDDITIGTTAILWGQVSSLSEVDAGDGLQKISKTISVKLTTLDGTEHIQTNPANALFVSSDGMNLKYLSVPPLGYRDRVKYDRYGRVVQSTTLVGTGNDQRGLITNRGYVNGELQIVSRAIDGTDNRISVTNKIGLSANPTIDIHANYVGQNTITTVGTITTGTWEGDDIEADYIGEHTHKASEITGAFSTSNQGRTINISERTFGGTQPYKFPGHLYADLTWWTEAHFRNNVQGGSTFDRWGLVGITRTTGQETDRDHDQLFEAQPFHARQWLDVLSESDTLGRIGNRAIHGSFLLKEDQYLQTTGNFTDRNSFCNDFTWTIQLIFHKSLPEAETKIFAANGTSSTSPTVNPTVTDTSEFLFSIVEDSSVWKLAVAKDRDIAGEGNLVMYFMNIDDVELGRPYTFSVVQERNTMRTYVDGKRVGSQSHGTNVTGSRRFGIRYFCPTKIKLFWGDEDANTDCFEIISSTVLNFPENDTDVLRLARSGGVPPCSLRRGEPVMQPYFGAVNALNPAQIGLEDSTDDDDVIRAHNSILTTNSTYPGGAGSINGVPSASQMLKVDVDSGDTSGGSGFTFRYRREIQAGEMVRVAGGFVLPTSNTYADRFVVRVEGGPASGWIRTLGSGAENRWQEFFFTFIMPVTSREIKFWFARDVNGSAVWGDNAIHPDDAAYFRFLNVGVAGATGWWDFSEFDPLATDVGNAAAQVHVRDKSMNSNYLTMGTDGLGVRNIGYPQNALYIHADNAQWTENLIAIYNDDTELFSVKGNGATSARRLGAATTSPSSNHGITINAVTDSGSNQGLMLGQSAGAKKRMELKQGNSAGIFSLWEGATPEEKIRLNAQDGSNSYFRGKVSIGWDAQIDTESRLYVRGVGSSGDRVIAQFQDSGTTNNVSSRVEVFCGSHRGGFIRGGQSSANDNAAFLQLGTLDSDGDPLSTILHLKNGRAGILRTDPAGFLHIGPSTPTIPQVVLTRGNTLTQAYPAGSLIFRYHQFSNPPATGENETNRGTYDGRIYFKRAIIQDTEGGTRQLATNAQRQAATEHVQRQFPLKHNERIGNTSAPTQRDFIIWHRLNTDFVQVSVREVASPWRVVQAEWRLFERADSATSGSSQNKSRQKAYDRRNAIVVSVNRALTNNQYEVVVVG